MAHLQDELNNTQQRVLPLQTSLSLRTSAQVYILPRFTDPPIIECSGATTQ